MQVLIVEDDINKASILRDFIEETYITTKIRVADSFQSGLKLALLDRPDVVLLDMSMPTYSMDSHGGRERRYAGRQILERLQYRDAPCLVVVITQFESFGTEDGTVITTDQLRQQLRSEFDERYLGLVHYEAADLTWQKHLHTLLDPIMEARRGD